MEDEEEDDSYFCSSSGDRADFLGRWPSRHTCWLYKPEFGNQPNNYNNHPSYLPVSCGAHPGSGSPGSCDMLSMEIWVNMIDCTTRRRSFSKLYQAFNIHILEDYNYIRLNIQPADIVCFQVEPDGSPSSHRQAAAARRPAAR
ncbi:hypothetical protein PGT21_003994 [Puccinia graminis f. sp. tritici]|uniref:Uncharacterized protein n=1 Tax=Puccinia graminis f. sp. tritici TaxID=56615 RepID=A0A5B0PWU5_PUCGR|nr:hypothetical protein PGT21_003994 [Puccinia graminis f. sp. tritici]